MTTDRLGTALHELVDRIDDDAVPPEPTDLWHTGTRRRVRSRALTALAAACVAGMVVLLAWPAGAPRASVPADGSGLLTTYPDRVSSPFGPRSTSSPGVTAAVVYDGTRAPLVVSPDGVVRTLPADAQGLTRPPSLSPDGRWVARGRVVTDLRSGTTVTPADQRDWSHGEEDVLVVERSWWSRDSRQVLVAPVGDQFPYSGAVLVGTDGTVTAVPPVLEGAAPTVAGWLDERTVLGVTASEEDWRLHTWQVGDDGWQDGPTVAWRPASTLDAAASLSPDGRRLLLRSMELADDGRGRTSWAMMFDARTGSLLGMPLTDGTLDASDRAEGSGVGWDGWGCPVAWRDGLPVSTDGGVRFVPPRFGQGDLVSLSPWLKGRCVAFAGDELRGRPVTNHLGWAQEWAGTLGLPALAVGALVVGFVALRRRSRRPTARWSVVDGTREG